MYLVNVAIEIKVCGTEKLLLLGFTQTKARTIATSKDAASFYMIQVSKRDILASRPLLLICELTNALAQI